jgi:hypothetical protein
MIQDALSSNLLFHISVVSFSASGVDVTDRLGHGHSLPNPYQFITHLSSYHLAPYEYSLDKRISCDSCGHAVACIRHYATSWKVAGSRPDEVNGFFSNFLILPTTLGPCLYSASRIN